MLSQIIGITWLNLRSIPSRPGSSLVVIVGLAGVVAVFTALLAMVAGFESTLGETGRADRALLLRDGSQSELNSVLDRFTLDLARTSPGVKRSAAGRPLTSAELVVITELPRRGQTSGVNVSVRGVEPMAFDLRPELRIVEGRRFEPGLRELIVGVGVRNQFSGTEVGSVLRFRGSDWTVVGVFDAGNGHNSELWADVGTAQSTFGRNNSFQSMLVQLESEQALDDLNKALSNVRELNSIKADRETDYYSGQTADFRNNIGTLATWVVGIMGLGAIFAALNSMYAAVASRTREIGTLRAIGFGGLPVAISVVVEAMVLAAIGGLIGAVIAYVLFNNAQVSTLGANFTQVVFAFTVTPPLVLQGLLIALVVGFVGGALPAWRAARVSVTDALRQA